MAERCGFNRPNRPGQQQPAMLPFVVEPGGVLGKPLGVKPLHLGTVAGFGMLGKSRALSGISPFIR